MSKGGWTAVQLKAALENWHLTFFINSHPPIYTLKIVIFGAVFGKILASYKRPLEI